MQIILLVLALILGASSAIEFIKMMNSRYPKKPHHIVLNILSTLMAVALLVFILK